MKVIIHALILISVGVSAVTRADERITLDQFLNLVRNQNLNLKVKSASAEAAKENSVGLSVPPPMAAVSQIQDQNGERATGFEITQTIPFPTKLTNSHSARKFEADAEQALKKSIEIEILSEARLAYFNLWQSQERLTLLDEKKNAIKNHIKLAKAGARSDSFLKIHILKAESDLDLLDNEILNAEQEHRDRQIQLAQMINRSPNDFKAEVAEPSLSPMPNMEMLKFPTQVEVKKYQLESLRSRENEAKASWLPDFNLKYREMGGTSMMSRYSEFMVGISLPFAFFWEPNSTSSKASAEKLVGEIQLQQEKLKIESKEASLLSRLKHLKQQLDQFSNKLLPRAEKRTHLVHNLAPRDMETLQDNRETLELFPDLKLKALEVRGQYEEAVSELLKYSSEDLK